MSRLRIAITADPYLPVPPTLYGGVERVVDSLARGLVARGHEVTLFAHPDGRTAGTLVPYGVPPHAGARARLGSIDRAEPRADCEAVFGDRAIVDAYERIYAEVTGQ